MARPRFRACAKNALEHIPLARQRFKVRSFKKMSAAPQRERFDHAKLRKGSRERIENRKKPRVFEGRPAEIRRGSRERFENRKKPRVFEGRQPKVRRGSRGQFENRKKPRVFEG